MPKPNVQRASNLLASITEEMLSGDLTGGLQDNNLRVEKLLLDLVRPHPVQPRRVLPERIHQAFHQQQFTPTQALRELIQIVQVAARQRSHPFSNVLELLAQTEDENETRDVLSPEETLLRDLVNLAVTIREDGQVNPLTVVDVSEGVTRMYRIETGERRYWATWLLRDFIPDSTPDGTIPCIIVPTRSASVFRQAKENTSRIGLTAVAMARQAALLLLSVHGYEIPATVVSSDYYRQALDLDLHGKQEYTATILSAMGGIGKMHFSRYKALLRLSDEALELADRHGLQEGVLRYILHLPTESQAEMVQQVIQFKLSAKQVKDICEQGEAAGDGDNDEKPTPPDMRLIKAMRSIEKQTPVGLAQALVREEKSIHLAKARVQSMIAFLAQINRVLEEESK